MAHDFCYKKDVESYVPTALRATTPLYPISTNDPRTKRDVSIRLILESLESGSFSNENKRRKHRKASAAKMLAFSLPSRRCFYNLKISGRSEPFGTGLCQWEILSLTSTIGKMARFIKAAFIVVHTLIDDFQNIVDAVVLQIKVAASDGNRESVLF